METETETPRALRGKVSGIVILVCALALGASQAGCSSSITPIVDEARAAGKTPENFPPDPFDYFPDMDRTAQNGGVAGDLQRLNLSRAEIQGRNTWMLWTGGNEAFWDWLAGYNPGFVDLLKLVDFNPEHQWRRFENAGLIVEPDTHAPGAADRYGLYIRQSTTGSARTPDEFRFGRSSGIVGLRLFANPKFDAAAAKRWDAKRYYDDPSYYLDPSLVRPYRVGMSCAFCHVGPHPLDPPVDVEEPRWSNLSATIGNQYLRTRAVFGNLLKRDNYYYHLLDSQLPGTLDTSLVPSDNINNANAQNAIFELGARLDRSGLFTHRTDDYKQQYLKRYGTNSMETGGDAAAKWPVLFYGLPDAYGNPRHTPRFLLDGSDSIGPWAALARVYLNIGTYHQRWVTLHNPLFGFSRARPFSMADAGKDSVYWAATELLVDDLAKYLLKASSPMRLKDAPDGAALVKGQGVPWAQELKAGRSVFASHCIVCHSSKQPEMFNATAPQDVLTLLTNRDYKTWADAEVETEEFWRDNYFSTDRRLPVSLVKTNAARSLATNGLAQKMWEDFSSQDYKNLQSIGKVRIWNPFTHTAEDMEMPPGGRGYYRPASLVSLWATAPFLHNNSVGRFDNDPSVEGRLSAFKDAINKLLVNGADDEEAASARLALGSDLNEATTERIAQDRGLIWRLPHAAQFKIPATQLPNLAARATGWPPALFAMPWIVPIVVFVLAALFIVFARRRWLRGVGYLLTVLAFFAAGATYLVAGLLVDVTVPPPAGLLPAGLPVNVVANLDVDKLTAEGPRAAVQRVWRVITLIREIEQLPAGAPSATKKIDELSQLLDEVGGNRDHVLDRGHYFGKGLTDRERQDLIDLLLTL